MKGNPGHCRILDHQPLDARFLPMLDSGLWNNMDAGFRLLLDAGFRLSGVCCNRPVFTEQISVLLIPEKIIKRL